MNKKLTFIGDVHAKWKGLAKIIQLHEQDNLFQLGDFGIGFGVNVSENDLPENFKFIPGNHDNQTECDQYKNYLGKFGSYPELDMYFVGGAESIDKYRRTEGIDWWRNEQITYCQAEQILNDYEKQKPKIVISHDCPLEQRLICLPYVSEESNNSSFTVKVLNEMFKIHQPKIWVHGHLHVRSINQIKSTLFVGLEELGTITFDSNLEPEI